MLPFPIDEEEVSCGWVVVWVGTAWVVEEGCGDEEVGCSGVLVGLGVDEDEVGGVEDGVVEELSGVEIGVVEAGEDEGEGGGTDPPPEDWAEDMMTETERRRKVEKMMWGMMRERREVSNLERTARANGKTRM